MVETSETLINPRRGPLQWLVLAGLAVLLVIGGLWYRHHRAQSGALGGGDVLVVGDQRGGVQALLQAAGELDHVPYKIEWALFPAAAPLLEALNAQAVDIGGIGGQPFAFAYASGAKIRVVYAGRQIDSPVRGQGSAIIVPANSPLHRVEDLKGHKLATIRGSAGQDLALRLFEKHGLKPGDVTWVYLANAEAKGALASGSIDAWSTWGAYTGYALLKDHQRALGDAHELPAQAGYYAANDHAIATKHAQIEDFVQRLARARQWAALHPDYYAAVLARETGLPLDVARFTVNDYITTSVPVGDGLRQETLDILTRYKAAGIIDKVPDLAGAYDGSFPVKP
jgi:sulfonate transport system substrate-binding protein